FFVKPRHEGEARRGFTLHRHGLFRRATTETIAPDEVLTEVCEVAAARWDLVFLCVPTSALEELDALLESVGDATVVTLQPGMHAQEELARRVPGSHLVAGTIAFIAYQAPLEGEALPPGTAVFHPPFAATLLSGEG